MRSIGFCTYCDLVDLDEKNALDIASTYGNGMGNMEGTCGALVQVGMIGSSQPKFAYCHGVNEGDNIPGQKGTTQCKFLKGVGTGEQLCECPDCVDGAFELLEALPY